MVVRNIVRAGRFLFTTIVKNKCVGATPIVVLQFRCLPKDSKKLPDGKGRGVFRSSDMSYQITGEDQVKHISPSHFEVGPKTGGREGVWCVCV